MNEQQRQFFQMLKGLQEESVLNTLQDFRQKPTEDMLYHATFEMMSRLLTYLDGYCTDSSFHLVHRETGIPLKCAPFLELHDTMSEYLKFQKTPDMLDGAEILEYSAIGNYGHCDGTDICYLAICRYVGDAKYYLFYCNADWAVMQDDCWDSAEECRNIAEQYGVTQWYR